MNAIKKMLNKLFPSTEIKFTSDLPEYKKILRVQFAIGYSFDRGETIWGEDVFDAYAYQFGSKIIIDKVSPYKTFTIPQRGHYEFYVKFILCDSFVLNELSPLRGEKGYFHKGDVIHLGLIKQFDIEIQ
jgi:hypothetical protein